MESREIRSKYLNYFKKQGHTIVPSDNLVPKNDPTLLFTSAGMVQFKDHLLGRIKLDYTRAVSCQKCLRTSDLENVGITARHCTFFQMLGNFSFGDYFKQEAIRWAWEFVTVELSLPKDKLWVTIYKDDEEAFKYWQSEAGVSQERIIRLGEDSNFWNMGETGPCGPCSEILIDQGEELGCRKPTCGPGCDCDRYLEFWNLVFTQFDRQPDRSLIPLPKKNIDTGLGLERLAAIQQKCPSIFETDLFTPIINFTQELTEKKYDENKKVQSSFRVIADHVRALTFAFSDGVLPSNEGRGYVLRRILRRAYRHGKLLGIEKPFLYRASDIVVDLMRDIYPELAEKRQHTSQTILAEETRFESTLNSGLALLDEAIQNTKSQKQTEVSHEIVFKLYDTFGFPVDLTEEILKEQNLNYDKNKFQEDLTHQQQRSRQAWAGSGETGHDEVYKEVQKQFGDTEFLGYKKLKTKAKVLAIIKNGVLVNEAIKEDNVEIIVEKTPFYAESGGQVGDIGFITGQRKLQIAIKDTQKYVSGSIVHIGSVLTGKIVVGQEITLTIDEDKRHDIAKNHTATHLLMASLRRVLGTHVEQAGSLVHPDYLRFDFTHFKALSDDETNRIEELINEKVQENIPVKWIETDMAKAREMGALAFFGEKYGERVRVVSIGKFDRELCGGTHLEATGDVGLFLIRSSGAVGSGVRRIEAVTGKRAYQTVKQWHDTLDSAADIAKTDIPSLPTRVEKLLEEHHQLSKELEKLKTKETTSKFKEIGHIDEIAGVRYIIQKFEEGGDTKTLLSLIDSLKPNLKNTAVVLGGILNGKVNLVCYVTPDLVNKLHAGKIIGQVAKIVGGGGGGRPDLAQAGGKEPEKLVEALNQVKEIIRLQLAS